MSVFEKIIHFLQYRIEIPKSFGTFHICALIITALAAVLLVWRFKNSSAKTMRRILLIIWITMVVLEIYKQLVFSMHVENGVATWEYQWYIFPLQFCSTPLYALPFIIFLKDGPVRNAFMVFFSSFSFFAGLAVMIYPNDVYIAYLGIDIQTMVHHGCMVAIGILVAAHNRDRTTWKNLLGSLFIFYTLAAAAMVLNLVLKERVNLFFISPYSDCTLPVLSIVHDLVPYPAFLAIYVIGFSGISALFFAIEKGFASLFQKINRKRKAL